MFGLLLFDKTIFFISNNNFSNITLKKENKKNMTKFSIIIPVCGEIETTKRCIDSINANTNDHEIIIIDNGSEPEYYGQEK